MLFQITNLWQILGWCLVFAGLILMNELGRRTKVGGMIIFVIIPAILTLYFILAHVGMFGGSANPTVAYMDGWFHYFKLYAADIGCVGFIYCLPLVLMMAYMCWTPRFQMFVAHRAVVIR